MTEILFKDIPFLRASYIDLKLCDKIVNFFEANLDLSHPGVTNSGVDPKVKKSTDMNMARSPFSAEYYSELEKVLDIYIKEYPACNNNHPFIIREGCNIQRYKPDEGFYEWHCERDGPGDRHLVFMTYLNDVTDAGETEFYDQKLKIKPRKGLTVIWPADWTFTHRGVASPSQTKYIATGWFNYIGFEDYKEWLRRKNKENMNESG